VGPAYVNNGATIGSDSSESLSPALPASLVKGNLLLGVLFSDNNATHTWSAGWAKLDQVVQGASFTASLGWRLADDAAAAPTINWTGAVPCGGVIWQLTDTDSSPFGAATSNSGAGSPHTTTGLTTTRDNSHVIYIDIASTNVALDQPAGWTEHQDSGAALGTFRRTIGGKDVLLAGSSSGNISVSGSTGNWVQWQLELLASEALSALYSELGVGLWDGVA
jgi:hypothetical protein